MRYYFRENSLFIRGSFRAASTGPDGGIKDITTFLYQYNPVTPIEPEKLVIDRAMNEGVPTSSVIGFVSMVPTDHMCILRYDHVRVFITADLSKDPAFSIIIVISGGMDDKMLLDLIIPITEGKLAALREMGQNHHLRSEIMVACESYHQCGHSREAVFESVRYGLHQAIARHIERSSHPSFFIHSTINGTRWVEWVQGDCPYYPCHFAGQRCDLCYCPLYPCEDESLGEWVMSRTESGRVWSCAPCTLNHQTVVVRHLKRNPEASLPELKSLLLQHPAG